ncbi:MAG TPA: adenosylcobinamide-phosphate synthase CbiB [Gemmatimonadaceae bacterium]|nr:adenosylcobinamide-phosphate synthase CbiB [Gemmatimonadaceae bacterium]
MTDLIAGEPPSVLHPTVWMGKGIAAARTRRREYRPIPSFTEGALALGGRVLLAAVIAGTVELGLRRARGPKRAIATGVALKPALSLRQLLNAAADVQVALQRRRLTEARRLLGWHLVSRDTTRLTASEVAGAAIESVAENLCDSVVAPLLAFRIGGLTLAYVYRMINTADAMLGYRTPELEWFGKASARVDDVANLVPARCAALLIACSAVAGRGSATAAAKCALFDADNTPSPNAGWPMAAMAGALGVRLAKRDTYVLNARGREPRPSDIARARRIVAASAALSAIIVDLA